MLKPLPGIEYKINLRQKNNHFDHGHWNLGCSGEGKSISLVSDEKNCRKSLPGIEYTVRPRDTRPQAARTLQVHVFE